VSGNIRLRAALCLALSLANSAKAQVEERRPCAEHAATVASWIAATRAVRAAERAIDAIEADPVLAQHSSCSDAALYAGRCSDSTYSREQELERAQARLDAAEEHVADVEEAARIAGVPMVCLVDPSQ
jgi:hypothetical protein